MSSTTTTTTDTSFNYYIVFDITNTNVIGYGTTDNNTSGINPRGSEEIYANYTDWAVRLNTLGYIVSDESVYIALVKSLTQ